MVTLSKNKHLRYSFERMGLGIHKERKPMKDFIEISDLSIIYMPEPQDFIRLKSLFPKVKNILSLEDKRKYHNERNHKLKKELVDMLSSRCQKCGYSKSMRALEFHHKNPKDKESNREWLKKGFEKKILEGKIKLLCSNCHAEEHD